MTVNAKSKRQSGEHAAENLLREIWSIYDGTEELIPDRVYGNDELAHARDVIRTLLPKAHILSAYALPEGKVDLAIFTDRFSLAIHADGNERLFRTPKLGRGGDNFDFSILLQDYHSVRHEIPSHVTVMRRVRRLGHAPYNFDGWYIVRKPTGKKALTPNRVLAQLRTEALEQILPTKGLTRHERIKRIADGLDVEQARKLVFNTIKANRKTTKLKSQALNGREIREALVEYLHVKSQAPFCTVPELQVGSAVADLAALSDDMDLYEIKGENDTKSRLRNQATEYDQCGRTCTLVTTRNHASFSSRLPTHWGLIYAHRENGRIAFVEIKASTPNQTRSARWLAEHLLTGELLPITRALGVSRKHVGFMRDAIVSAFDISTIGRLAAAAVARRNKRAAWRATTTKTTGNFPTLHELWKPLLAAISKRATSASASKKEHRERPLLDYNADGSTRAL